MGNDSLDISKMNVNPGGKQRVMHNGYTGMVEYLKILWLMYQGPWKSFLQECGVDTTNMNGDQMKEVLKQYPDFIDEKWQIERLLVDIGV